MARGMCVTRRDARNLYRVMKKRIETELKKKGVTTETEAHWTEARIKAWREKSIKMGMDPKMVAEAEQFIRQEKYTTKYSNDDPDKHTYLHVMKGKNKKEGFNYNIKAASMKVPCGTNQQCVAEVSLVKHTRSDGSVTFNNSTFTVMRSLGKDSKGPGDTKKIGEPPVDLWVFVCDEDQGAPTEIKEAAVDRRIKAAEAYLAKNPVTSNPDTWTGKAIDAQKEIQSAKYIKRFFFSAIALVTKNFGVAMKLMEGPIVR